MEGGNDVIVDAIVDFSLAANDDLDGDVVAVIAPLPLSGEIIILTFLRCYCSCCRLRIIVDKFLDDPSLPFLSLLLLLSAGSPLLLLSLRTSPLLPLSLYE